MLPCSVTPERIWKNFEIFDWSLSEEELARMSQIEPQVCLFGTSLATARGTTPISFSGHLQAVHETDDDSELES